MTTIRLRGPADIITVLPYHLGYRPSDSLVLVLLAGSRIGVVARVDLPPPGVDPMALVDELLPVLIRESRREEMGRFVIVGFETKPGDAEPSSVRMRDALVDVGVEVVQRLLVRGERWWRLDCDGGCCPTDGALLPSEEEVPAVSDYIVLGRSPATSGAGWPTGSPTPTTLRRTLGAQR